MHWNCIFPGRYAPLTYYEDVLEASRNRPYSRGIMNKLSCVSHVMLFQKEPQKRGVTYSQNGF